MKEKTNEPTPVVMIGEHVSLFVLDEGDTYPMNTSTTYNHRFHGPSLVHRDTHQGMKSNEYYVNDSDLWEWIDQMMQLGEKYLKEHPDFDMVEFRKSLKKKRKGYEKFKQKSLHKE